MAETISIGAVVKLCSWVWLHCRNMIDAPQEFKRVRDQARSTLGVLKGIQSDSEKKGSIYRITGPNASKQLKMHMKSIKRVLNQLKHIIEEFAGLSVLDRWFRGPHFMRKLPALRQSLLQYQQPLQLYMLRVLAKNSEETKKAAQKAAEKANTKLSRIMNNQQMATKAQVKKIDEVLRQVKKLEAQRSKTTAAIVSSDSQASTKGLKDDLVKKGIAGKDVQDNIKKIKTYLKADEKTKENLEDVVGARSKKVGKSSAKSLNQTKLLVKES